MSKTYQKLTAALATCAALAAAPAWAADFPMGDYAAKRVPATITFGENGQVRVMQRGALKVDGAYKVDGNRIELTDNSGPWACTKPGERTGSYRWKAEKGGLSFTKIADGCKARDQSLTRYAWKKKS